MDYHLIVFGLVILYWIGTGIVRFFRWAGRPATATAVKPNLLPQAINAQQQNPVQTSPMQTPAPPADAPPQATAEDFRRWEQELKTERERATAYFRQRAEALRTERDKAFPRSLQAAMPSDKPAASDKPIPMETAQPSLVPAELFQGQDDLVRAFILQQVLGAPLSRRHRNSP